jgi:nucleoside-diphosphate-sugar epimerase
MGPGYVRHAAVIARLQSLVVTTLLTGATSVLGRRLRPILEARGERLVELPLGTGAREPAAVLVHLTPGDHDRLAGRRANAVRLTEEALAEADAAGVTHLVHMSSAMVYGAWPNNPVPLTEDAPLRPGSFAFAQQLADAELLADTWRVARPGRTVTVLRPVLTMAAEGTSSIVRALAAVMGSRLGDDDPPAQFLHVDDLMSAVLLAIDRRLDGVYNVAPDGAVAGETVRALAGSPPRLKLPPWLVGPVGAIRWRFQRGPIPSGLRSYASYAWLVANDRLRAEGWEPTVTNEQAYVEGTEAKWWTMLTPQRKQELSLTAMGLGVAGSVAGTIAAIRAAQRR